MNGLIKELMNILCNMENVNLHNYYSIHVCPSLVQRLSVVHPSVHQRPFLSTFGFSSYSGFQMPSQTPAEQGIVELHILNFKTTWSEFKILSHTAAALGKAELCILDSKTTWSEFQSLSQTTTCAGQSELHILLKPHFSLYSPPQSQSQVVVLR